MQVMEVKSKLDIIKIEAPLYEHFSFFNIKNDESWMDKSQSNYKKKDASYVG